MTNVVIGAGPAGLSAAWELSRIGLPAVVLEGDDVVGGLARTVRHGDHRFDVGGHRFYTRLPEVQRLWEDALGQDLLLRPRRSRILYQGRLFDYPLQPLDALRGLGPLESVRVVASYLAAAVIRRGEDRSFEDWVSRRFGRRLFEIFFRTYSEKVWGLPCSRISADWAAQRIRDADLGVILRNALFGSGSRSIATTLIDRFHYPRLGPGMMWERFAERLASRGVETLLRSPVTRLTRDGDRVVEVVAATPAGERSFAAAHVLSSMPLPHLVARLDPPPPPEVREAAAGLSHRAFVSVGLVVRRPVPFADNWIYVHTPGVKVGRVQFFGNWSPEMAPGPGSSLGLEYFCDAGDALWRLDDAELVDLATRESEALGLARREDVASGVVIRMPHAYPVYGPGYRERVEVVRGWLAGLANLQSIGRNGQHRYDNQDRAMLTGLRAARRLAGATDDPWTVEDAHEYLESGPVARLAPLPVAPGAIPERHTDLPGLARAAAGVSAFVASLWMFFQRLR